jgi:hypothetical protein
MQNQLVTRLCGSKKVGGSHGFRNLNISSVTGPHISLIPNSAASIDPLRQVEQLVP